jgi:uncharacterized RDD family membrane protein YckC
MGYPPPPPSAGYGTQPGWGQPAAGPLAEWAQRVVGTLLDGAIVVAAYIVVILVAFILGKIVGVLGALVLVFGYLAMFAYGIVQLIKQGNTGQTIGKKVVGLKVIKEETGQPIGPGLSIGRQLCHIVDSLICYIGWLFPLWDAKKQTIADKLVGTVVVQVPKQPFNTADLYTLN